MMQVTVKTLDSQTKLFSVSKEATVRDFKQQIEQELEIAVDRQRLIFKGKVLQDEKKLQECGVDGCVVHLVQRVPPSNSNTRTQDTSTPTSTGASAGPGGGSNFVMGAFTVPIDVMGVTQQIVQSLVNQLGVDSAQANISTTQSDDGAALNVHINLHASSQTGSDVSQRLLRARNFLRSARESLNRTEGEGMLSGPAVMETSEMEQPTTDSGNESQEAQLSQSPLNLAEILREVQQISASLQPALDRYATLLSSSSSTGLQPSDDSLPDRIAETLHNLSHSFHALSDLTFNVRSEEPRRYVRVLPPLSPHSSSMPLSGLFHPRRNVAPTQRTSSSQTRAPSNGQTEQQRTSPSIHPTITLSVNPQGGIAFTSMSTIRRAMTQAPPTSDRNTGPTTSSATIARTLPRNIFAPDFVSHTSSASTGTTNSTTNRQAANGRVVLDDIIAMISGSTGPVLSPQTSAASAPSSSSSSSGSQQQNQSTIPSSQLVRVNPVSATHPDPSVPCQSFHFGPQAQNILPGSNTNHQVTSATSPSAGDHPEVGQQGTSVEEFVQQLRETMGSTRAESYEVREWPSIDEYRRQTEVRERRRAQSQNDGNRGNRQRVRRSPETQSSDSLFNDLLRSIMTQMGSSPGNAAPDREGDQRIQTLAEMIRSVDSSQIDEPDEEGDLINPLFRRLSNFLTVPDLMAMLSGSHETFGRMRPELMMYVRVDLLRGGEATDENLKRASQKLVHQIVEQIYDGFSGVAVKDGIDLKASLTSLLDFYIERGVRLITSSEDNPHFGEQFYGLLQDMSSEFFTLLVMCLRNGTNGLQEIVDNRVSHSVVTEGLAPGMQRMFSQLLLSHMHQTYERRRDAEPRLQQHLIRIGASDGAAATKPVEPVHQTSTSQASGANLVTTQRDEALSEASDQSDDFATPPASIVTQEHEDNDVAMESDDANVDIDEDWKAVMPQEWVPIIRRDIVHQRRMHPQAPFSDAYLGGVPPKRRKMIDQRGLVATEEVLPEALKRAATAAGVSPRTSVEDFASAVGEDKELHQAYKKELRKEVQTRLQQDSDYKPEQFPNAREYFDDKPKRN